MRILFDKNVPYNLRAVLSHHQIQTSDKLGWGQLKNGILLKAAEVAGFEVVLTSDQNLTYQQNLKDRNIALIVLGAGNWPIIKNYIPAIVLAVDSARKNSYAFLEMPLPPKPLYQRNQ